MNQITVNGKAVGRLRAGHLWVFSDDLLDSSDAEDGDVVRLKSERGRDLGSALFSASSRIALRWVAPPGTRVDRAFWRQRLESAIAYRARVVERSEAYRLVFGERDLLPSLIVDRYRDLVVLQTLSKGMDRLKSMWVDLLRELLSPRGIVERNDAKVRLLENLPLVSGVLAGELPPSVRATINGLQFEIDLLAGQKTGAFLDQRENYSAAERIASGEVLDCFSYAGGFALHMARSETRVTAIDSSPEALESGRRNAELNGISGIQWVEGNAFDLLKAFDQQKRVFDAVVLDPPAFAKNRASLRAALRGYKEINLRAIKLLKPGGRLLTCSCSYHVDPELFLGIVASASADARRPLRILEIRGQARDHPLLSTMPETRYLKCLVAQVL